MITNVSKDVFRRIFIGALVNIGMDMETANKFCMPNNPIRLKDLKVCMNISVFIDEFIESKVPEYKGCLPKDNWDEILDYNYND